jgi:hypothetical protein
MANTYSQIYIHTVFAVDGRLSLIGPEFKKKNEIALLTERGISYGTWCYKHLAPGGAKTRNPDM